MKHLSIATMLAIGCLALGSVAPVYAQAGSAIGYIDMERVFNAANARKTGEDRVNNLARALKERVDKLQEAAFVAPATWQQYKTLLEKEKRTAEDDKSLQAIADQLSRLDAEIKSLQQPTGGQLTDAQKTRLNEMNGNRTANLGNLQGLGGEYEMQIIKLQSELRNNIVADIQKAAGAVAKSRNVGIVLNRQVAVGDEMTQLLVVAGGTDLTDDVIKQVNS